MKILFSEADPDFERYIFPYVVWAVPEPGDTPARLMASGFLPSAMRAHRFVLCRNLRVNLSQFSLTSENRRVLRKCTEFESQIVAREDFDFTEAWRGLCLEHISARIGSEVMPESRLRRLLDSPLATHLLLVTHRETGMASGLAVLYLEPGEAAFYAAAFYDVSGLKKSLGVYLLLSMVQQVHAQGYRYAYLGSCYKRSALYKWQFRGMQFFSGVRWSSEKSELKYLLARGETQQPGHLLESEPYLDQFFDGDLSPALSATPFRF